MAERFAWLAQEKAFGVGQLSAAAQAAEEDAGEGLQWNVWFPRDPVDDIEVPVIGKVSFRPASDRREWNTRGRAIPLRTPPVGRIEITPIEAYFTVDEQELTRLMLQTANDQRLFRQRIGANIPQRVRGLAEANYRRIEVEAFAAWTLGQIIVRDPQTGAETLVEFDFDPDRYQTSGVDWMDPTVNAYDELLQWLEEGAEFVNGMPVGIQTRLALARKIQADAPTEDGIRLTMAELVETISDEIGGPFDILVNERQVDVFTDGGLDTEKVFLWPEGIVAAIPPGENIGRTVFAPTIRAWDAMAELQGANFDVNGMTAYAEANNGGRQLVVECQANALPIPDEDALWVLDTQGP